MLRYLLTTTAHALPSCDVSQPSIVAAQCVYAVYNELGALRKSEIKCMYTTNNELGGLKEPKIRWLC